MDNQLIDINSGNHNLPKPNTVLVLGICSIVGAFLYGIPGLVCGIIGLAISGKAGKIPETADNAKALETIKAGRICSIIGVILSGIMLLLIGVLVTIIANHEF